MRILLVEDDPTTSRSIELMLTHANLNVYCTDMGEDGIDLAKLYDYDLILLDLNLPDMSEVSTIIRHHHERYDGQGFPDGLIGATIPIGARILAVAEDYDELQQGWLADQKLSAKDAARFVSNASGRRYDPEVIGALPKALEEFGSTPLEHEQIVSAKKLKIGSMLTRDFIGPDGYLWGTKGQVVNGRMIAKFRDGEDVIGHSMKIYIMKPNALADKS